MPGALALAGMVEGGWGRWWHRGATQAAPVPTDTVSVSLQMREREVKLWDTRRLSGATLTVALDTSPG